MQQQAYCDICYDHHLFDSFLFLRCGHGFCSRCCNQIKQCSICRQPIKSGDRKPVYATFVDPASPLSYNEHRARRVTEGLNLMDAESPILSLEKAGRKIRQVAQGASASGSGGSIDPATAEGLLESAKRLDEKVDLLRSLEEAKEESFQNQQKMANLQEEYARMQLRSKYVVDTKDEAIERQKDVISQKSEEYIALQREFAKLQREFDLQRAKLKALAKAAKRRQAPTFDDHSSSLQIEHRPSPGSPRLLEQHAAAHSFKNNGSSEPEENHLETIAKRFSVPSVRITGIGNAGHTTSDRRKRLKLSA